MPRSHLPRRAPPRLLFGRIDRGCILYRPITVLAGTSSAISASYTIRESVGTSRDVGVKSESILNVLLFLEFNLVLKLFLSG